METLTPALVWPRWRRVLFRCSFIFLLLLAAPWTWLNNLPGFEWLEQLTTAADSWVVNGFNRAILHVRPVLVPLNGSGDTSYGWAQLWTYLILALAGGIVWSVADRRRPNYIALNYWLCVLVRYSLAFVCFIYGITKLFVSQMPFPSVSDLATPLGDFLPMRLSWMFFGYSAPYQFFSGLMECLAGALLVWRRTATLGALVAAGVFLNVAVLNLSYDIPVKIFSLEMLLLSLFLLSNEARRLACFFLLNRPAEACSIYHYQLRRRWLRIARVALKCAFLALTIGYMGWDSWELYSEAHAPVFEAFPTELYTVEDFRRNGAPVTDSSRWTDLALNGRGSATLKGAQPDLPLRYGRRQFMYDVDTEAKTMRITSVEDERELASLRYERPDSLHIDLAGAWGRDSLQLRLLRTRHRYPLTERQFHWLSERNR